MTHGKRPFRFGVIGEATGKRDQLMTTARQAEELGYASFLLRDHFLPEPFGNQLAPLVGLMAAAAETRTLRVGTLVLANDYRHSFMLAKEAATLDLLSGGRFELGIGAGWMREEYERAGMAFDAPATRVDRLEESLCILKKLLRGGEVSFSGAYYSMTG